MPRISYAVLLLATLWLLAGCNDGNVAGCSTDQITGASGDCATACSSDAACDDGDACNGLEVCQAGACYGGTPVVTPD